jgi:hypothetical protein
MLTSTTVALTTPFLSPVFRIHQFSPRNRKWRMPSIKASTENSVLKTVVGDFDSEYNFHRTLLCCWGSNPKHSSCRTSALPLSYILKPSTALLKSFR